jgi:hypothetical protein
MTRKILLSFGVILLGVLVSASFLRTASVQASERTPGPISTSFLRAMPAQASGATPSPTSTGQCNFDTTPISFGSTGDCVKMWQELLVFASMYCRADLGAQNLTSENGFGLQTQAATVYLQRDEGLTIDGIVGQATWGAMVTQLTQPTQCSNNKAAPAQASGATPSPTSTGQCNFDTTPISFGNGNTGADPCVMLWQQQLKNASNCLLDLGAQDLAIDGIFGLQTQAATVYFQRDEGLSVDGIVGHNTHAAMEQMPSGCK